MQKKIHNCCSHKKTVKYTDKKDGETLSNTKKTTNQGRTVKQMSLSTLPKYIVGIAFKTSLNYMKDLFPQSLRNIAFKRMKSLSDRVTTIATYTKNKIEANTWLRQALAPVVWLLQTIAEYSKITTAMVAGLLAERMYLGIFVALGTVVFTFLIQTKSYCATTGEVGLPGTCRCPHGH